MRDIYADLHIHIGKAQNKPIKITGSQKLTFENILKESAFRKGLDLVGVIDSASPLVLGEIKNLIERGELTPLKEGGLEYRGKTVVVLGAELETYEHNGGTPHFLCFFPHYDNILEFSNFVSQYISNINLSSQNCKIPASQLLNIVESFGGILIPAHAFTPFKSVYGSTCKRLTDIFSAEEVKKIPAVELGLSADSLIADRIKELNSKTFLSNSDAHSLSKIAREYNVVYVEKPNYKEMLLALWNKKGRFVKANYGLDPRLGKYHRTKCLDCDNVTELEPPVLKCNKCGSTNIVKGVLDRITQIQDFNKITPRPEYHYQIPLEFIPKVGPKTINKLIEAFGSEMAVLHKASFDELKAVVATDIAKNIILARQGRLEILSGGGGGYGRIINV